MKLEEFNNKYGLVDSHIFVAIGSGRLQKSVLYKPINDSYHIDENFFLRRIAFRNKVKNYIQDMYFLLTEVASDIRLGKAFGIVNTYFSQGLWSRYENTIINYQINGTDWKFYRKLRKLHRRIERLGVKFDIADILDNEAGICQKDEVKTQLLELRNQSLLAMNQEIKNLSQVG